MPELVAVPNLPGVPAVAFAPGFAAGLALASGDAPGLLSALGGAGAQRWGLFRRGRPVISGEIVAAFDHRKEWVVANYPLERGAFESYDKVELPYTVRLIYCSGSSEQSRTDLIQSVLAVAGDLNFYDAAMPEKVFPNCNIIHYDFARSAQRGSGLLAVALYLQEVRQTTSGTSVSGNPSATGSIGQTASASGGDPVDGGTVQSQDATPAEMQGVGTQAFAGGYSVGSYDLSTGGTLGPGNFGVNTDFGNVSGVASPIETSVGPITVQDGVTGQTLIAPPQTTSTISGLQAAGPDQYRTFGVSP